MQISNEVIFTVGAVVCFLGFLEMLRCPITAFLSRANKLQFKLLGILIEATAPEFLKMFENIYARLLRPAHIEFFQRIVKLKDMPKVIEVIPDFRQHTDPWFKTEEGKAAQGIARVGVH